ncbi:hypothetical protein AK830_g8291 [Neonectria ditissima]|uniref:Uncharacterized protein n=1 Tax=Neonectria ditissima TaxID=78410 RepID=A0A0P7BCZ3_9HYPO|nr:hypothetical protein AK830_g8291 [Neonectria ditissima]
MVMIYNDPSGQGKNPNPAMNGFVAPQQAMNGYAVPQQAANNAGAAPQGQNPVDHNAMLAHANAHHGVAMNNQGMNHVQANHYGADHHPNNNLIWDFGQNMLGGNMDHQLFAQVPANIENANFAQAGNNLDNDFERMAIADHAENVVFDYGAQAGPAPAGAGMNLNAMVANAQVQVQAASPAANNGFANYDMPADGNINIHLDYGAQPAAGVNNIELANNMDLGNVNDVNVQFAQAAADENALVHYGNQLMNDDNSDDGEADEEMDAPGEEVAAPGGDAVYFSAANHPAFQNDARAQVIIDQDGTQRVQFDTTHDIIQLLIVGPEGIDQNNMAPLYERLLACFVGLRLVANALPANANNAIAAAGNQAVAPVAAAPNPPAAAPVNRRLSARDPRITRLRREFMEAHPPGDDTTSRNDFIHLGRHWQFTYREIKEMGNMREAYSTLRGRHRNLLIRIARDVQERRRARHNLLAQQARYELRLRLAHQAALRAQLAAQQQVLALAQNQQGPN